MMSRLWAAIPAREANAVSRCHRRAGTLRLASLVSILVASSVAAPAASSAAASVAGPIPGTVPGNPASPVLSETYPFFSTWLDLAASGYVEEEFYVSGLADAYSTAGAPAGGRRGGRLPEQRRRS